MRKIFIMIVAAFMIGSTQQVQAQKWLKNLGKGLDAVGKAMSSGSSTTSSSSNSSASSSSNGNYDREYALYKIHRTGQTKTITVDGNPTFMGYFNEGLCVIGWKRGWFIINKQGDKVFDIKQGYEPCKDGGGFVGYCSNRLMTYSRSENKAIIYDNFGREIRVMDDVITATGFTRDGVALVKKRIKTGQYNYKEEWKHIDINGYIISEAMTVTTYSHRLYEPDKNGLARVWDDKLKKWGFRNNKCQWVIKPKFTKVGGFYEGLAVAYDESQEKWGYINETGNWAIFPKFTNEPYNFHSGLAMVVDKQNYTHFISKTGSIVWSNDKPNGISSGIREFMDNGKAIWSLDDGIYIVNTSFQKVCKLKLGPAERGAGDKVLAYCDEWFEWLTSWREDGRLFDYKGNPLLYFDEGYGAQTFSDRMCKARYGYYYFNDKGEIIVEFKDTQF